MKTGANTGCICGSGKKYKHCCRDKPKKKIISTFIQNISDIASKHLDQLRLEVGSQTLQLCVFDTTFNNKNVITGITTGTLESDGNVSFYNGLVGNAIIECMTYNQDIKFSKNKLFIFAEIKHEANAERCIQQFFDEAPSGAALLIVCANDDIWGVALDLIGADFSTLIDTQRDGITDEVNTHTTPRRPNDRLRYRVLSRDNFKCVKCGASPASDPTIKLHVDHVKAWSKGGETVFENLQTTCSKCNYGKSNHFDE